MTLKRMLCLGLSLCLLWGTGLAELDSAEDEFDLVELLDEEPMSEGDALWSFPVALEDLDPDYIRLANKHMYLPKDYSATPLVTIPTRKVKSDGTTNGGVRKASSGTMKLQETCAAALVQMFEDANDQGVKLYLKSAWRSWQTQNTMYYNRLKKYGYDDGWVIKPGASDHQTGLGCDVVSYAWRDRGMNAQFAKTTEAQWMAAHCAEYGFVIRYPEDKVDVTEINYEPWHLRYVGVAAATYIMSNGLCLEEFHDQLSAAIEAYVAAGGDEARVKPLIQVSYEDTY